MKTETKAWWDKAESSFDFAQSCTRPPLNLSYDAVCLRIADFRVGVKIQEGKAQK